MALYRTAHATLMTDGGSGYSQQNITKLSIICSKISVFNDILNTLSKAEQNIDDGYNYFKNGGCVFGGNPLVTNEYNDCKEKIQLAKDKCTKYIQELEKIKNQ